MKRMSYLKGIFLTTTCPKCKKELHPILPTILTRYSIDEREIFVCCGLCKPEIRIEGTFIRFYARCKSCELDLLVDYTLDELKGFFEAMERITVEEGFSFNDQRDDDISDEKN